MADRYWVGGTASWDATAGTKWSATDGGAGGASNPTSIDNVHIKGSDMVTISATANCADLDFTGFTGALAGSSPLNVYGNLTFSNLMVRTYNGSLSMRATSGTKNITSNGLTLSSFTLNGSGGIFQLMDKLRITATLTNTAGSFIANGQDVEMTANVAITGNFVFYNLIRIAASATSYIAFASNTVVSNVLTLKGTSPAIRLHVKSNTVGTPITLTCNGSIVAEYVDFQDITGAGSANWDLSAITGLSGDCGGNTGITFTTPSTQHWINANGGPFSTASNWTSRVPLPQDTCVMDCAFGASKTVTQDMQRIGNIDWTGATGTPAFTTNWATEVYGGITLISGMNLTNSTNPYTFMGRGSYTLTSAGKTWAKAITLDAPGGTLTLQDNLIMGIANTLTVTRGHFNANNNNVTCAIVSSSNSNVRTITMGSGVWELLTNGTIWNTGTITNLTLNPDTSTIKFTNNSINVKDFNGGGKTFYDLWIATQNTGQTTIYGNNTFNQLKATSGRVINLVASSTTKISAIDMVGATLQSTTTTPATLDLQNIVPMSALSSVTLNYINVINAGAEGGSGTNIFLGTENTKIYLGTIQLSKVYLGTTQIY